MKWQSKVCNINLAYSVSQDSNEVNGDICHFSLERVLFSANKTPNLSQKKLFNKISKGKLHQPLVNVNPFVNHSFPWENIDITLSSSSLLLILEFPIVNQLVNPN